MSTTSASKHTQTRSQSGPEAPGSWERGTGHPAQSHTVTVPGWQGLELYTHTLCSHLHREGLSTAHSAFCCCFGAY